METPLIILQANSIGCFARARLLQGGKGSVLGCTSSGVFCLTASQRILFLTAENKPGPLNINLDSLPNISSSCWMGTAMEQSSQSLVFPAMGLQADLADAEVWQPPPLPPVKTTSKERRKLIHAIACELLRAKRETILLPILKWLVNPPLQIITPFTSRFDWLVKREELAHAFRSNEPLRVALALQPIFGMGTGLTPSGDDFIWGFLLALSRWQSLLCPRFDLGKLGKLLVASARRSTTLLSASLVECAALGWADAGILSVLDALFTGQRSFHQMAETLLAYGSASGMDAFAGMAAALQSCSHSNNTHIPQGIAFPE